jgi:hypothetical protein
MGVGELTQIWAQWVHRGDCMMDVYMLHGEWVAQACALMEERIAWLMVGTWAGGKAEWVWVEN